MKHGTLEWMVASTTLFEAASAAEGVAWCSAFYADRGCAKYASLFAAVNVLARVVMKDVANYGTHCELRNSVSQQTVERMRCPAVELGITWSVFFITSAVAEQAGDTNAVPLGVHVRTPWPRQDAAQANQFSYAKCTFRRPRQWIVGLQVQIFVNNRFMDPMLVTCTC